MTEKKSILIFGGGNLQQYVLQNAKQKGFRTIVIDPNENAFCKHHADIFRVVGGKDFENTLKIAQEFNVNGIITSATDKPLIMMAQIAEKLQLPFYSVNTAINSTDKLKMKHIFLQNNIPCASGIEIQDFSEYNGGFPIIIKPRDNSGSRGVYLCRNDEELATVFNEVKNYSNKETVLVEEFIDGKEYSIESLHYDERHHVIQFTEKTTTPFPYNVELAHKQPADLSEEKENEISEIIKNIGITFGFNNCASHTELKITNEGKIKIIETSPRLGGDFITSHLVPLSTGINMESLLLDIAIGNKIQLPEKRNNASMAYFFHSQSGTKCTKIEDKLIELKKNQKIIDFEFRLCDGDVFPVIKNSLDRYGHIIIQSENRLKLIENEKKITCLFE